MNWMRVLLACLLLAVAPLAAYATPACCPSTKAAQDHGHASHAPAPSADHGAAHAGDCGDLACALHCAGVPVLALELGVLPTIGVDALPVASPLGHFPAAPSRAPDRPPRSLPPA